jgi:NitT/TauT family transport system substrate-binding protein
MARIDIMALRHSAFYAPLLLTIHGGYLERRGLEPCYRVQTPDDLIVDNLRRGSAHLAQSAPAVSFAPLEQGEELDILHFAAINDRDGFYLTAREPMPDFRWQDLEGRAVLVDHLFQPMATLRYVMHQNQADFDRMEVIDAGNVDEMDAAFRSGRGDFVHQQGPAPQQLEQDGVGHLVASVGEALGPIAFSSLCATREWLETDMALAFLDAYAEAMADLVGMTPQRIAATIGPALPGIDEAVLVRTLSDYQKLGTWNSDISIKPESYETLLKVFRHSGLISRDHPMDALIVDIRKD